MLSCLRLDRCLMQVAMGLALSWESLNSLKCSARSWVSTIYLNMSLDEGYRSDYINRARHMGQLC
jgi:hypothetical protein